MGTTRHNIRAAARRRNMPLPAVAPDAAQRFLNRRLDSWDWLKECPETELRALARETGYRFPTDPWHHQLVCFWLASCLPSFLFFLEMGGGKSKIILDQIRFRRREGHLRRALVLVPELVHVSSWEEQIREHAPDVTYSLLMGSKAQRERALAMNTDLCVTNYAGLQSHMGKRVKAKEGREVRVAALEGSEFAARFNFLAMDEMHKVLSNPRGNIYFEMCRWLSLAADFRYGLSGTPFGRDPAPLWSLFNLVDHGATLGTTLTPFRHAFYTPKKHYWKGIEWVYNRASEPVLRQVIKHRSIHYSLEELAPHLPRRVAMRIPVRLSPEAQGYYDRILDGIKESRGDYEVLNSSYLRMRQVCSGFLSLKADDSSRIQVRFKDNAKLKGLAEFLKGRQDEKMLVFHEYTVTGQLLEEMLVAEKVPHAVLRGGMGAEGGREYERFLRDRKCRVFLLNNSIGSEAINPQRVTRRVVFYEGPDDPKKRAQAEARVRRPGQGEVQFIHDVVAVGTIDEKILRFNAEGRNLLKAVLAGKTTLEHVALQDLFAQR